jgi:hypothetical protein
MRMIKGRNVRIRIEKRREDKKRGEKENKTRKKEYRRYVPVG